jgi:DNA primase
MSVSIPQDFIQELLAKVNIVELIDRRVTLKKMGINFAACCPFHAEKTPSFTVSAPKQFYYCFGCGAHGDAIGFLIAYDRLSFVEAVEELANFLGIPMPQESSHNKQPNQLSLYALTEQAMRYYQSQLVRVVSAQNYLTSRGLSIEIIKQFALGFAPNGWDNLLRQFNRSMQPQLIEVGLLIKSEQGKIYDRFRNRIMIPIRDSRGRIIGFGGRALGDELPKYLNSPETVLFHKGSELYGLYEARQNNNSILDFILVVEGYMDVIALQQFGICNAVATLGTATSQKHLQKLFRHTQQIIFCFDGDKAGQDAAWRALEVSLSVLHDGLQIRFMFLPAEHDPDSLIRQEGSQGFKEHIAQAISLADFFFGRLSLLANPQTMDGKARFAKLGFELINKIRNGVFQQLMLEKLASVVGVEIEKLSMFCFNEITAKPVTLRDDSTRSLKTNAKKPQKTLSPIQLAIALILQYPQLVLDVALPESLNRITLPGITILLKLFELLKSNPNISTAQLLEHWYGAKIYENLAKLSFTELLIPASGVQAELSAILLRLIKISREQEIQDLIVKSKNQTITTQEKGYLLELLRERC